MIWKSKYKGLYQRVRKIIGNPSESTLDKQLQRKSNKNGLASPPAALIMLAAEKGIGYQKEFQFLAEPQQNRLTTLIQNLNNNGQTAANINTKFLNRKKVLLINDIGNEYTDPYLTDGDYKRVPSYAYSIIYILENSVRTFIARIMNGSYGSDWWNEIKKPKSLKDIVENVESRKTTESQNWYHSKRGVHQIFYTDYDNLIKIIRAFDKDFSKFFKKGAEKNLVGKLDELTPTRNVIAHNNPITGKDLERLKVNAGDWFLYMTHLYKEDEK